MHYNIIIIASTWTLLIVALKPLHVSVFVTPSQYWSQVLSIDTSLLYSAGYVEYLGSPPNQGFTGYLRDFRIYSDTSFVNFQSSGPLYYIIFYQKALSNLFLFDVDFTTCCSGCTYSIGMNTLIVPTGTFTCLTLATSPVCTTGMSLFLTDNTCYSNINLLRLTL